MKTSTSAHAIGNDAPPSLQLRTAIAASHTSIEDQPLAQAMMSGELHRDVYVSLLQHLHALHSMVESDAFPRVELDASVLDATRADAVERDLIALGSSVADSLPGAALLESFHSRLQDESSAALAGVVYVLEGSRMGSMVLHKPLARALKVESQMGVGLDYHLEGMSTTPARVKAMKGQVDELLGTPDAVSAASGLAVAAMELLEELYAVAWQSSPSPQTSL